MIAQEGLARRGSEHGDAREELDRREDAMGRLLARRLDGVGDAAVGEGEGRARAVADERLASDVIVR